MCSTACCCCPGPPSSWTTLSALSSRIHIVTRTFQLASTQAVACKQQLSSTAETRQHTDQETSKAEVAILLLEASEIKDSQHCVLSFWQLLQRLLQDQNAEPFAVIQRKLSCRGK